MRIRSCASLSFRVPSSMNILRIWSMLSFLLRCSFRHFSARLAGTPAIALGISPFKNIFSSSLLAQDTTIKRNTESEVSQRGSLLKGCIDGDGVSKPNPSSKRIFNSLQKFEYKSLILVL
mmetsp:Transcript_27632/g.38412  ORF Transcript_27632/g.38412 Transcript_27632/m.38412 type:complete len:120 (+) Transcript_27632:187-546(+)